MVRTRTATTLARPGPGLPRAGDTSRPARLPRFAVGYGGMSTPNPWTVVPAADYERHMGPEGVNQLAPLSALFQESYLAAQPDRLLLLGCTTGNGLGVTAHASGARCCRL